MSSEKYHFLVELLRILQTKEKQFEQLNDVFSCFTDTKRYALFQNVKDICICRLSSSFYEDELRESSRKILSLNEGGITNTEKYDIIMKSPNHNLSLIPLVQEKINRCEGYLVLYEKDYRILEKKSSTRFCLRGLTSFLINMRIWEQNRNSYYQDPLLGIFSEHVFQNDLRYLLDKKELDYNICIVEFRALKKINEEQGFVNGSEVYHQEITKIKNLVSENDRLYRLYGNKCILLIKGDIHHIYEHVKKNILDSISTDYAAVLYELKMMEKQVNTEEPMDIIYRQLLNTVRGTENREIKIYV